MDRERKGMEEERGGRGEGEGRIEKGRKGRREEEEAVEDKKGGYAGKKNSMSIE